jgi:hypothetical protein
MGLHDPFGFLKHKLRPKEGLGVQLAIWFRPLKVEIASISLLANGVPHTVGKILTKATTLVKTSPQLKVSTQNYGRPKLQES